MEHTSRNAMRLAEGALALAALAALAGVWPPRDLTTVAVFATLVFLAENAGVLLPSSASVSASSMLVMAGMTALSESTDAAPAAAGSALIAAAGGLFIGSLRDRRYGVVVFNVSQFLLAGLGAGASFAALQALMDGRDVVAAPAAAAVFTAINAGLVLLYVARQHCVRIGAVWNDMRPALPNSMAFGLLGVLVGHLYIEIGVLALPLLLVPAGIARATYSSYLDLRRAHDTAVNVFVRAIEAKDRYTAGHCERVARYAAYIGDELGFHPSRIEHLRYAALMHDIGKLAVPSSLLNKPGKLTPQEWELVRRHNDVCIDILTRVDFLRSTVPAASDKHAHYGKGEVREDAEALEAYAIAVADAFDAMTSTRSYRRALTQHVAFAELRACAGTQFHPPSVEALIRAIERRGETYGDGYEVEVEDFAVAPPVVGVGSAGLGDLLPDPTPGLA